MGEVIPFRKNQANHELKGRRLCAGGYHQWEVIARKPVDDDDRIVWEYRCGRCGATRTHLR